MIITSNVYLKNGLGNGTRCLGISLQLKKGCALKCKTWDGRMVHTVSCLDVEYMICETIPNNKRKNQDDLNWSKRKILSILE